MPSRVQLKKETMVIGLKRLDAKTRWLAVNHQPQSNSDFVLLGNNSVNTSPWQQIQATTEELLDASFSMRFVSYQLSVCGAICVFL
jgi:hypothetical protein